MRVKKFLAGPGVVIAAIAGGSVILFGLFYLLSISGLSQADVSARQGETVQVDGGTLTALKWCALIDCPGGGAGTTQVWVRVCATEDGWSVEQADFYAEGVRGHSGEQVLAARSTALRSRTLDAGDCAQGTTAFRLGESPAYLTYFGHGYSVLWELMGTARIPLTEAVLAQVRVDERQWLVEFEKFYRRATGILSREPTRWLVETNLGAGPIWSYHPESITPAALRALASLGEDCDRTLRRAGDPGRFKTVARVTGSACERFSAAADHFRRALAKGPDATPPAGTAPEGSTMDLGIDDAWNGLHALVRAHDRALVILSAPR